MQRQEEIFHFNWNIPYGLAWNRSRHGLSLKCNHCDSRCLKWSDSSPLLLTFCCWNSENDRCVEPAERCFRENVWLLGALVVSVILFVKNAAPQTASFANNIKWSGWHESISDQLDVTRSHLTVISLEYSGSRFFFMLRSVHIGRPSTLPVLPNHSIFSCYPSFLENWRWGILSSLLSNRMQ